MTDCEICNHWVGDRDYDYPKEYETRHCSHCGQLMDNHDWSKHPHQLFGYNGKPEDCPGWYEVLDESFEE